MLYFLYNLLKAILYMEQEWNQILIKREIELDQRQKSIDTLFQLFNILVIKKKDVPETGDFILKFKRCDIVASKPGEDIAKYAIIEEDK